MTQIIDLTANSNHIAGQSFKVGNFQAGENKSEVSRQWISRAPDERYLSLSALLASVTDRADNSREIRIPTKKIEFLAPEIRTIEDTHKLELGLPDGSIIGPNHWSFGQIASLAGAPASYLRELPSQIVVDCLKWGMRKNRNVDEVKLYESKSTLRAATGPDYGRIFDKDVVEAVMQIAGNGLGEMRWKIPGVLNWQNMVYDPNAPVTLDSTTLYASDRDVYIFLVDDRNPIEVGKLPDGSPDYMFRGFILSNSETGNGAMRICAFYLRAVCMNRNLWGVEGFQEISIRHSKHAPARFIEEARPALESFANGSEKKLIDGVNKAKEAKVAEDQDEALAFLRGRDFSKKRATDILEAVEREEGHPARSIWDMVNGITAVARNEPNNDTRIEMEMVAGRLLDKVAA